jgi:hypothetical protein
MDTKDTKAWWQYGYVWFIIAGPLLVVVAGFITLYLAIKLPDPVIDDNYYQKGIEINKTLNAKGDGMAPALQARNHAATGIKPSQP